MSSHRIPSSSPLFDRRSAGVLLHPTSLPSDSDFPFGDIGRNAHRFIDFLADAGFSIWQMLPIGPTHNDLSPYQALSAHAGNSQLISLTWLAERQWIEPDDIGLQSGDVTLRKETRQRAAQYFFRNVATGSNHGTTVVEQLTIEQNFFVQEGRFVQSESDTYNETLIAETSIEQDYLDFCKANESWLYDFALFQTLREVYSHKSWNEWPSLLAKREQKALNDARNKYSEEIKFYCFEQFIFFQQWHELREYARNKGVYLFGDMPIFVAQDSADVWACQEYFRLDSSGQPLTVAGVPPDYFSEFGQHWGNPHYDWERMQADGFKWWLARLGSQLKLFDLIRIDHFRGFEAFWEIPGGVKDARQGRWVKAPGKDFLAACFKQYQSLPLVAENLGLITEEVEQLRHEFHLPGMLVLQFGFDGNANNPHLPHNHGALDVIYTGTHDNDTTLGWYNALNENSRKQIDDYFCGAQEPMPWLLVKAALSSVSQMVIVPMQDLLELGSEHRMNMPGTTEKNWTWCFSWEQVPEHLAAKARSLLDLYGRLAIT